MIAGDDGWWSADLVVDQDQGYAFRLDDVRCALDFCLRVHAEGGQSVLELEEVDEARRRYR